MVTKFKPANVGKAHQGNNIKRVRLLLGIQQKEVATGLGGGWDQKRISKTEAMQDVALKVRTDMAKFFGVDVDIFDAFDEAAAQLALKHIMRFNKFRLSNENLEDHWLMEDITILLENAIASVHRERQNMQLLLRLLQQMKSRSRQWTADMNAANNSEVNEPAVVWSKVA